MKFADKRVTLEQLSQISGVKPHRIRRLFYPDNNVHLRMPELHKIAEAFTHYGIPVTGKELKGDWNTLDNYYLRWYARRKAIKKSLLEAARILRQMQWAASLPIQTPTQKHRGILLEF